MDRKTWEEFSGNGLLWLINTILHVFGWSIILGVDDDNEIIDVFPARISDRGFDDKTNEIGYQKLSKYMADNSQDLYNEAIAAKTVDDSNLEEEKDG